MRLVSLSLVLVGLAASALSARAQSPTGRCDPKTRLTPAGQPCLYTIQTAVPFLTISPDARSSAMGDVGIALSPTAASTYWNASALGFAEETFEVMGTYTPWLRALNLQDVYLANLQGYGKLDELQTVYGSLRYFSLGDIEFTDQNGQAISTGNPYEMGFSAGYARKLTDEWSASLTGRFILSSLASGLQVPGEAETIGNGTAGAADIGVTYRSDVAVANGGILQVGGVIRNIGSKITYTNSTERDYLPTNLGIGASLQSYFDDYNSLTFALDFNKLLVPSTLINGAVDVDPENGRADFLDKSPIEGLFTSFGDAEDNGGELAEVNFSLGAEYWYADQFAARAGYFFESNSRGGRKYLTIGVGLRYNVLGLDFSYLVPTTSVRNPLDNTLRFGLSYALQSEADEASDF